MPTCHLEPLDREAYSASIEQITDAKSSGFARLARDWWDLHFSWKVHGCIALTDEKGAHLSYIFYKIDRYREYITVHNLFTPRPHRRHGYARELLRLVFKQACNEHVRRFRLASVPQSLDFYLSIGLVYWGINSQGDYYCDLPLPEKGLDGIGAMVQEMDAAGLVGGNFDTIYAKVGGNEMLLSAEQQLAFQSDRRKLGKDYRYDLLMGLRAKRSGK
jgi:GNAT superfamily N-acetyltransferase